MSDPWRIAGKTIAEVKYDQNQSDGDDSLYLRFTDGSTLTIYGLSVASTGALTFTRTEVFA